MNRTRTPRPDIDSISLHAGTEWANPGQVWYETARAYELWQAQPYKVRVKRISKDRVFRVNRKRDQP